uniref:UvrB/UvrC motif-containing protein n=1 Tax=Dialister sp. TaxID=1955814 RepID=UPI003FEE8AAB
MLCERCHAHPATVHMVQVVNGHRKEEHLCSECAEKEHVFQKEQSFFGSGFFDSPLDHFFGGSMLGHLLEDPFGGRTLEDQGGQFIEVSPEKLPENEDGYNRFKESIRPSFQKGKNEIPVNEPKAKEKANAPAESEELQALRRELKSCVDREDFERACEVRDKIKALESKKS